ncbi:MAG: TIM barrel protein [Lachnospiraceae bacterium]|nr:TIM barrel protein [Lachnospiraceae bacterium]
MDMGKGGGDIKLCLTLYSFSWEYASRKLSLEEILRKAKEMGYSGIELVASQMVPGYPYPTEEWMGYFSGLLEKYGLEPICYSAYIDMGIHSDRDLCEEEIFNFTLNDMICAKRMGFALVRTQHAISPAIYKKMLPYCKKLGMILAIEMHHPHNPEVPVWKELLSIMGESDGYLGVVPDFSIFAEKPHAFHITQAIEDFGGRPEKVAEIARRHQDGADEDTLLAGDYNDGEKTFIKDVFHTYGNGKANLGWMRELLPVTVYIHGKFWYMGDDEVDHTTPCDKLIPIIKESGYKGYIASEYEGHHFNPDTDTQEQLGRWVRMTNRLLGV